MYEHQSGEFVCGYWAINLRVNLFQHFNTSACAISFFLSWLNPLYNNLMMSSELICPSIRKSVLVYAFLAFITAFGDPLALSYSSASASSLSSATTSSFFFFSLSFLLFFLLSFFLEGVAVLAAYSRHILIW